MNMTLCKKDGNVHAFMFYIKTGVELQINMKLEERLSYIQNEGYEVVDVKLSQAGGGGWSAMVLYK